jgi:serine O-acetyltransferase
MCRNSTTNVVIGNKNLEDYNTWVNIGDNCYFGLRAKVFGEVNIGKNVVIGTNSVVVEYITDNFLGTRIPAKL